MQILLVEPDKIQADNCMEALRRDGHSVVHARSAQQAVHLADEWLPDLVLLELQLPQHNGVEFLYEFRSYHEWLQVPIVLHTFVPPLELTRGAALHKELGVVHTLYKPATCLRQLCAVLRGLALTPSIAVP